MSGPKDVHRTKTKRERVLEVMQTPEMFFLFGTGMCMAYAVLGACIMMTIEPTRYTDFLPSLHFAIITIMTIGYGDLTPQTDTGKMFICGYVIVWLLVLANAASQYVVSVIELRGVERELTRQDHLRNVAYTILGLAALLLSGAITYSTIEKKSFVDGIYWATITLSTVGYGDMVAKATGSQIFSLFYDFLGVILFAYGAARILTSLSEYQMAVYVEKMIARGVTEEMVAQMDRNNDDSVCRLEFLRVMLVEMRKCSESDIQRVLNIFDRLDVDGDGELNANDIVARRLTLTGAQGEGLPVA